MPQINNNSNRQKVLNLAIGATAQFPLVKMRSIRAMVCELHKITKHRYTTTTTPSYIKVTCVSRPEKETN